MPDPQPPRPSRRQLLQAGLAAGAAAAAGCSNPPPPKYLPPPPTRPPFDPPARPEPVPNRLWFRDGAASQEPERTVLSACQFCNSNCGLQVGVSQERVVSIAPLPEVRDAVQGSQLCVKADLMAELVDNAQRLTTPLIRTGGEKGSRDSTFAPVSWDEALDAVAQAWLALRDAGEARAIANRTTGRMIRGAGELIGRILTLLGSPNAHDVGPVCNDAGGDALRLTFGLPYFTNGYGVDPGNGNEDLGRAKLLLLFGTNQAETHPVTFDYLLRQRRWVQSRMVVIDPRETPTAKQADLHLAIRPGTDLALVLGMLGHIIDEFLIDVHFVREHVLGFDALRDHVHEHGYGPAWAARVCDVPADAIVELAEAYAQTKPAAIFCNAGVSHQVNAFATYRALAALAALTGNIGQPGGGCNFMHNTWPGPLTLPPLRGVTLPDPGPAVPAGPDHFADAILDGRPYPLKAVMSQGNPLVSSANSRRVREAYAQLEHFTYTGLFMEEAAWYADVILPVASGLELEGVYMRRDDRGVRWQAQAVPRVGESRTDAEIFVGLAQALARHDRHHPPQVWAEAIPPAWSDYGALWDTFVEHTPAMAGMTRARLQARGEPLRWPCPAEDHPGVSTLYQDHPRWYEAAKALGAKGQRFLTPSGKVELHTPALDALLRESGHEALPRYFTHPETTGTHPRLQVDPARLVPNPLKPFSLTPVASFTTPRGSTAGDRYPLVGITGRPSVVHFATVSHWTPSGKRLDGVRGIQVHPDTLARFELSHGQRIHVTSPRGRIEGVAQATPAIRPDTVFVPQGFGPAQDMADAVRRPTYAEPANALLDADHFDTLSGQQAYKCFACKLEPIR